MHNEDATHANDPAALDIPEDILNAARAAGRAEAVALIEGVVSELERTLALWSQDPRMGTPGADVVVGALRTAATRLG